MDIKLQDTEWHRVTADEIRETDKLRKSRAARTLSGRPSGPSAYEKKKILMLDPEQTPPEVESDGDYQSTN